MTKPKQPVAALRAHNLMRKPTSRKTTKPEDDQGKNQAKAQYESVCEMVAALECDYDELGRLREEKEPDGSLAASDELQELEDAAGNCKSREDAYERITEDALSVEVRGAWHDPYKPEDSKPTHFKILLCTGGPAVRIMGELDEHGQPYRAWLEYQDWGTQWVPYFDADQATLLAYARCFYFGE